MFGIFIWKILKNIFSMLLNPIIFLLYICIEHSVWKSNNIIIILIFIILYYIIYYIYVSLQLRVQKRRRKWNFLLNFQNCIIWTSPFLLDIRNAINWGGVFSKAFRSSEALISVLSKMPTCMIIFKILFSQKHCTLYLYSNGHI